jgi:hypothetical protein
VIDLGELRRSVPPQGASLPAPLAPRPVSSAVAASKSVYGHLVGGSMTSSLLSPTSGHLVPTPLGEMREHRRASRFGKRTDFLDL